MFRVFDGAYKDLSIDTFKVYSQSQPIWHHKENPCKHRELEIDRAVMSQSWMGLSVALLQRSIVYLLQTVLVNSHFLPNPDRITNFSRSTKQHVFGIN